MSLFVPASDKMAADRQGSPLNVTEATPPTSAGPEAHGAMTDLGGIDHLFRDPFYAALHVVAKPLEVATGATTGPWGGKVPGYLTHAGVALKADGEQLVEGALHGAQTALRAPGDLFAPFRTLAHRIRLALGV